MSNSDKILFAQEKSRARVHVIAVLRARNILSARAKSADPAMMINIWRSQNEHKHTYQAVTSSQLEPA